MFHNWFYRLRALLQRGALERELEEEMRHHAAATSQPVSESELEQAREACRDARGVNAVETTLRDLRFAGRGLRQAPGFTLTAGLTLTLGLGAAVAIFAVADAVLLQPLAYRDSGQLLLLRERLPTISSTPFPVSAPDIPLLQAAGASFTGVGSFQQEQLDLAGAGEATQVMAARVSAGLFPLVGAQPRLGSNFTPAQDRPGQNVVIVSDALWRHRMGSDPRAVGRQLRLEGKDYTVVGVMPPSFEFPPRGMPSQIPAELWVPMAFTPQEMGDIADNFNIGVIARLRRGATVAEARTQMAVAAGRVRQFWIAKYGAAANIPVEVHADSLGTQVVAGTRAMMYLLLAAAALLLLMSCANVVNLVLVRTAGRRHELAMRAALGASRGRLVRQSLSEAMVLALGAGMAAMAIAWGLLHGLTAAAPATLPQVRNISLGGRVPLAALALTLGTGLICGLLPALMGTRELHAALREGSPTLTHARRESLWRTALTVAQIAIAFVLVCGAALLLRSFIAAEAGGAGVRTAGVISAALPLPQAQYSSHAADLAFYRRLDAVLNAQPGVVAVAEATDLPTQANWDHIFTVENQPSRGKAALPMTIQTLTLGDYFRVLGIPLVEGRDFNASEREGKAKVVIVSAALAARYWPHGQAVGHRLKWGDVASPGPWLSVVGVAGDVKEAALDEPATFHTYSPYAQECHGDDGTFCGSLNLVVQSRLPTSAVAAQVRTAVRQLDPTVPVSRLRTMSTVLADSITPRRFNTALISTFGLAALLLSAVGLYAMLAFAVAGQRREIGVRMALGAAPAAILAMVLRRGLMWSAVGLGAGALAAWGLTRYLVSLLYQTSAADPITWLAVAVLLVGVALAACALPARRASRLSPALTLRE